MLLVFIVWWGNGIGCEECGAGWLSSRVRILHESVCFFFFYYDPGATLFYTILFVGIVMCVLVSGCLPVSSVVFRGLPLSSVVFPDIHLRSHETSGVLVCSLLPAKLCLYSVFVFFFLLSPPHISSLPLPSFLFRAHSPLRYILSRLLLSAMLLTAV